MDEWRHAAVQLEEEFGSVHRRQFITPGGRPSAPGRPRPGPSGCPPRRAAASTACGRAPPRRTARARRACARWRSGSSAANSGSTVGGEQFERGADVLVAVAAGLLDEDHLVDTDVAHLAEVAASVVGRSDAARVPVAERLGLGDPALDAVRRASALELAPQVGASRSLIVGDERVRARSRRTRTPPARGGSPRPDPRAARNR